MGTGRRGRLENVAHVAYATPLGHAAATPLQLRVRVAKSKLAAQNVRRKRQVRGTRGVRGVEAETKTQRGGGRCSYIEREQGAAHFTPRAPSERTPDRMVGEELVKTRDRNGATRGARRVREVDAGAGAWREGGRLGGDTRRARRHRTSRPACPAALDRGTLWRFSC